MISIIICSVNDARFQAIANNFAGMLKGEEYELIRIPDARSLAEGYNRGLARSKGDIIILCHDDILILNMDFKDRLRRHLERFDLIGVAGTTRVIGGNWGLAAHPYMYGQVAYPDASPGAFDVAIFAVPSRTVANIQALDGLFLAGHRHVVQQIGFDERTFDGFHCYDADFTFRAYLAGFHLAVCCDINIFHASRGNYDDVWDKYDGAFRQKFRNQLHPMSPRPFRYGEVFVHNREEMLEVMNPAYWSAV
jgi:GT2 family glycosyltransferase